MSRFSDGQSPGWGLMVLRLGLGLLLLGWLTGRGAAHTADESYLVIRVDGTNVSGQLDLARRDLQQGLRLGGVVPESLGAEELLRREEAFGLELVGKLEIRVDDQLLPLEVTDFTTLTLNNGPYARLLFAAGGLERPPAVVRANCRALFAIDPSMHGLLRFEHAGRSQAVAYTKETPLHEFTLAGSVGRWQQWVTFVWEGVWHIWIGLDHILFLIALLLPAVFRQGGGGRWEVVDRFRPALINVLKIVTAFTVAHSITLSLAALEVVRLESRLVESAIAASVVLAATNNLYPWFKDKGWMVAFGFGLIHGFGFASVLGDLGLTQVSLVGALVGFNVGVELGQLAIVAVFLPVAFGLRGSWFYRELVLKAGSALVIGLAGVWMVERLFDVKVLPGL